MNESQQFRRLIPQEVLNLVSGLREKAKELTNQYFKNKNSVLPHLDYAKVPDPFYPGGSINIAFLSIEEFKRLDLSGQGVASRKPINGERVVYYRIPMTSYDTIYHELVHAFDPKFILGLSKPQRSGGFQSMGTPHEVDAYIGGFVDEMQNRLNVAPPERKKDLLGELRYWLSYINKGDEPEDMPTLLKGMQIYHLRKDPAIWKKFLSIIYNQIR